MATHSFPTQLRVVRHRSVHEIDETLWDSINAARDVFHTHRFIRSVQDAGVEDSQFWYLLFFRDNDLVATAALSTFTVSLDLMMGGTNARFIQAFRRWLPNFLRIKILFCGLPISLGQSNLVIRDCAHTNQILAVLVKEMSEICRAQNISYLCVKELFPDQAQSFRALETHGFFLANSIPYVFIKVRWQNFVTYLANLRHGYRRPIKLALKKIGQKQPEIIPSDSLSRNLDYPQFVLGGREVCSPEKFFELYLQVMERAPVKLETLNQSFFEKLYANTQGDWDVLALVKRDEILGAALLTTANKTMTFALVGLDYAQRDNYATYFNLVYGIVQLAIQRGCAELNLGQTSYWLKQRIGGVCVPEYFYFKANNRLTHFCIRTLRALLFPATILPTLNVFRDTT